MDQGRQLSTPIISALWRMSMTCAGFVFYDRKVRLSRLDGRALTPLLKMRATGFAIRASWSYPVEGSGR